MDHSRSIESKAKGTLMLERLYPESMTIQYGLHPALDCIGKWDTALPFTYVSRTLVNSQLLLVKLFQYTIYSLRRYPDPEPENGDGRQEEVKCISGAQLRRREILKCRCRKRSDEWRSPVVIFRLKMLWFHGYGSASPVSTERRNLAPNTLRKCITWKIEYYSILQNI
jgi:hypothetical protein